MGESRRSARWLRLGGFALASFGFAWLVQVLLVPILLADAPLTREEVLAGPTVIAEIVLDPRRLLSGEMIMSCVPPLMVVALQMLFLLPIARPLEVGSTRRRLWPSAVVAGAIGGGLAAALAFALLELLAWDRSAAEVFGDATFLLAPLASLLLGWSVWGWVLFRRVHRAGAADPLALDRMLLPLLKGTVIATVLLVPLDAMVRRKKDCYCFTGGAFGLALGLAALVWLVGPWMLLAASRRRRRSIRRRICLGCGYPRGGIQAARCPECGRGYRAPDRPEFHRVQRA